MWDFLLGPDRTPDLGAPNGVLLGPRVYDIDVVDGIEYLMRERLAVQDAAWEEARRDPNKPELQAAPSERWPVQLWMVTLAAEGTGSASVVRYVTTQEARNLSATERERLVMSGAGIDVGLGRRAGNHIQGTDKELIDQVESFLRSEGRRIVPIRRMLTALPSVAAVVLVAFWIVILATHRLDGFLIAFGSIVTVGSSVAGVLATRSWHRWQAGRGNNGHRFREGTRADFRAAVTNFKATSLSAGAGTFLGVLLTVLFYWVFRIQPV